MTPEEAIKLLDHAAACAQGNRMDHVRVQEAVKVLTDLIKSIEKPKEP